MRKLAIVSVLASLMLGAQATHAQTVPAGTPIVVTLDQSVSSKDARVGDKVAASVARDVVIGGRSVIPQGSPASVHVASVRASGRLKTPARLYLRLDTITVRGEGYSVSTHYAGGSAKSHKKRNVVAIGGGTAAGAVIGGLAGGGTGAAIGAAAGAGAGTAGAALTGKKNITFPAETRLSFTLKSAVTIH
jgi:hypothetical protein